MKRAGFVLIGLLALSPIISAQEAVGIFENQTDIGEPGFLGLVTFENDVYSLEAGGAEIGYRRLDDSFYFVNTEMTGNFAIEGYPLPLYTAGWGGLMIRDTLDADSPHASIMIASSGRGTNSTTGSFHPFFRSSKGGGTKTDGDFEPGGWSDEHTGPVRLERVGNTFRFYRMNVDKNWVLDRTEIVPMNDPVYVGLAATAANDNDLTNYDFSNVAIEEFPATVERTLPTEEMQPGAALSPVTLTAKVREGLTEDLFVTELPPKAGTISNVVATAGTATLNADGSVTWDWPGASGEATLTYDLVLGNKPTATFHGTFNMGDVTGNFLAGDAILPKIPSFQPPEDPIPIDPILPTVIQAEWGYRLDETAQHLMVFPQLDNGVVVMSANGTAADALEYRLDIQQAGTYYIFGYVRGEDGNSDSLRHEYDFPPGGAQENTLQYWGIGGNKSFVYDWANSSAADPDLGTPAYSQRPFEFLEGENFFYIGNREDDASIDFFVVTSNPDMDIANFDEDAISLARTIPNPTIQPGGSHEVSINILAGASASYNLTITEMTPPDWPISNVNASSGEATPGENQIVWTLTGASGVQTLTYTVSPPADAIGGIFDGSGLLNGIDTLQLGTSVISSVFEFENINVENPTPVQLVNGEAKIEAEEAYLLKSTDADPFSIRYRPDASQELYAYTEMGGSSTITGDELDFVFEIVEPGTYRAIARTCTPSGEDDSYYVGMDDDIQAVISGYRFQGKIVEDENGNRIYDDNFNVSWVDADDAPDLSWDLSAGVHTLRFHIRENGTMVDWVMLTNNLDQNPDELDPNYTSIDHFMLY